VINKAVSTRIPVAFLHRKLQPIYDEFGKRTNDEILRLDPVVDCTRRIDDEASASQHGEGLKERSGSMPMKKKTVTVQRLHRAGA